MNNFQANESTLIASNPSNFTEPLQYSTEQLDNTSGLSNSSVNTIFQDSEDLLWIGTWDGLNRYDGNHFKTFRPELNNENSLTNQVILKIDEDKSGFIWVLTIHGLNKYDKKSNTFTRYFFSRDDKPPLTESEFNMALDASKNVYCAVKDWGIGYFDRGEFQLLKIDSLPKSAVKKMAFTGSGKLLLLFSTNQLYTLQIATIDGVKKATQIVEISNHVTDFEVFSNNGVCYITDSKSAVLYHEDEETRQPLVDIQSVSIISKIKEGVLLHHPSGYFIVDSSGKIVSRTWVEQLKKQKTTAVLEGTEQIIWTGTDGDGLFKLYPQQQVFNSVSKVQIPEIDGGIIRAFLEVEDHSFWVGTKGNGLLRLPHQFYLNPKETFQYRNFNESNSSINNAVYALHKGQDDLVFIGTDGNGLSVFDINTDRLIDWTEILGSEACSFFKSTYAIYQDEDGFIWLGTNGYGMIRFKLSRIDDKLKISEFKTYEARGDKEVAASSNIIFSIIPKSDHELWIGTRLGGLNLFNKGTETFKTFEHKKDDPESLSNNDILYLHTDSDNRLWVGTSLGLNLLKEIQGDTLPIFQNFTTADGLRNNTIHGIVSDANSNLWLSTNFGLTNYLVADSKFINYTKSEGLQDNEFADGAIYQHPRSDYIFAGGVKGFNYFVSSRINESDLIPNILIDKISGQNEEVPYYQGLVISPNSTTSPSIILGHDQNFFDIELSAVSFINNKKNQYAYKLENFDQDWNVINNWRTFSFTNVPQGNYTLWLKWSNSDGNWGPPVRAINFEIKPVFWQSNAALVVYGLLLLLFIVFVWSYFGKQYKLRQHILSQQREEEIHQNRLNFFTNVAHEFQTPLTLILGPIQRLSKSATMVSTDQKLVRMIERNSSRLLFLTQQLLEFRRAEDGHLGVSIKQFDLVNLVEQIAELFDEWALQKNIDYTLEIPSELSGWFDKDKIEIILFNLLSNAFKYTPEKGKITLTIAIEENESRELNIEVINTGKGIPKDKLESIFDRFFLADNKVDNDKFRTGIGLAYIKKMVNLLGGEVHVSSEEHKVTTFKVALPCNKKAFPDHELDWEEGHVLISGHLQNIIKEVAGSSYSAPNKISALENLLNRKKSILIVEDEKEIHAFLNELLEEKFKIFTAFNGVEAIKILQNDEPDLIISDVMMPEMDGIDFCYQVKSNIKTCHIPIIMLTAKTNVVHRIQGLESGANAYIPKPFHPDHLLVRVEKLLEEKELVLKHFTRDGFLENLFKLPVDNEDKIFLLDVIEIIRENIENEHLHTSFIEQKLAMSSSQLYRKIKQIFGFSPGDLIRTIRLKHAAELLIKSNLTVSEVCYQSGFNNRSYFYREFKKTYNSTPKEYQLQKKHIRVI
ncbi:hybrid sensor histidine kinase/response regulator transcription factor [Gelidibacter sp.]|uniref:hybrid sensor histidine kinase/response regulator transcription factor n=1 Tax=Gelidibacter sp. TaxID=2018083 RepID=UPI002B989410|nr:response regulator [Gelidibacter sp.]HUH28034.1 response regulator [Gelidibacter sp.]